MSVITESEAQYTAEHRQVTAKSGLVQSGGQKPTRVRARGNMNQDDQLDRTGYKPSNTGGKLDRLAGQPAAIAIGSYRIERAKAKSSERIAMPRGGSKPGERRGGRQKGTPNRKTVERQLITERMLEHPSAGVESWKLGRDVLAQYMCTFDELAEQYRKTN